MPAPHNCVTSALNLLPTSPHTLWSFLSNILPSGLKNLFSDPSIILKCLLKDPILKKNSCQYATRKKSK